MLTFFRKTFSAEYTHINLGKRREPLHFPPETEYFQLIFSWFGTGVPRKHQAGNSHPSPSTLGASLHLRYKSMWEKKKKNTGLQGAEITTHASPGTWTFQIPQKEIIFLKQLSSLMPFFGFFWQTIPSSASLCHSLSTACLLGNAVAGSLTEPEKAIYRSWGIGTHFPQASKTQARIKLTLHWQ